MHASTKSPDTPGLPAIQSLARPDMTAVDTLIRERLASDVVLINQVAEYIIGAGGKRLRPMLLLLAVGATGESGRIGADAHQLAAVVEFIHTSTLLHDDVVDESDLRRGRKTANAVWGNAASVLVGDFLYSRMRGRREGKAEGAADPLATVLHEIAGELRQIRAVVEK